MPGVLLRSQHLMGVWLTAINGLGARLRADFFTSVINQKLPTIIGVTVAVYIVSFTFWAAIWYAVWR